MCATELKQRDTPMERNLPIHRREGCSDAAGERGGGSKRGREPFDSPHDFARELCTKQTAEIRHTSPTYGIPLACTRPVCFFARPLSVSSALCSFAPTNPSAMCHAPRALATL